MPDVGERKVVLMAAMAKCRGLWWPQSVWRFGGALHVAAMGEMATVELPVHVGQLQNNSDAEIA